MSEWCSCGAVVVLVWCGSHHNHTTLTLNGCGVVVVSVWCGCGVVVVSVWCGCGAVVVRAGLGEGCHLWATVGIRINKSMY